MQITNFTTSILGAGVIVVYACAVGPIPETRAIRSEALATERQVQPHQQTRQGLFYGFSRNGSQTHAWLIWLDPQQLKGSLYAPPGAAPLSDVRLSTSGTLAFSATHMSGVIYQFQGTLLEKEISGEMRILPNAGVPIRQAIRLYRQPLPAPNTPDWQRSGLYSSAVMNDLSGDLNGIEMVVVNAENPVGAYVRFGGRFFPDPLVDTVKTEDGFTFKLRTEGTVWSYSAAYRARTLILRRTVPSSRRNVVLEKRKNIEEIFQ